MKLSVYNVKGNLVSNIVYQHMMEGSKEVRWTANDDRGFAFSRRIYFYHLAAGGFVQTMKVLLLR